MTCLRKNEGSTDPARSPVLTPKEVKECVEKERKWLEDNNAVSAVSGGPVEDLEGIPLPADIHQGVPPTRKK